MGDIHGQLNDLAMILEKNGMPSKHTHFLFNGDFVDRGNFFLFPSLPFTAFYSNLSFSLSLTFFPKKDVFFSLSLSLSLSLSIEKRSKLLSTSIIGPRSVEVLISLYALLCAAPQYVHLNRGNHEHHRINAKYGFEKESLQVSKKSFSSHSFSYIRPHSPHPFFTVTYIYKYIYIYTYILFSLFIYIDAQFLKELR